MAREVGKDKFKTDFEDDKGDGKGDVGFNVDAPDEIGEDGEKNSDGDEHVVHSLGARGKKNFGAVGSALFFEIEGKGEFKADADDENDDGCGGVVNRFGFLEFFDCFDDNVDAGGDDDEGYDDRCDAFDFVAFLAEFLALSEFFADDNDETRDGVD